VLIFFYVGARVDKENDVTGILEQCFSIKNKSENVSEGLYGEQKTCHTLVFVSAEPEVAGFG
jgi:hypothetical protein